MTSELRILLQILRKTDDSVMTPEGVTSIPVVIDLMSLGLMKGESTCQEHPTASLQIGATLHHATELIGSSFRIQGNPQAKDGGACGCGISWEAK
jgi:Fe-S cluster assembly iron-binding protein IscA